jgi:tetratricopeptide (TPR) repeat protein
MRTLRRSPNLKVIEEHAGASKEEGLAVGRSLKCDIVLFVRGERQGDRFRVQLEALAEALRLDPHYYPIYDNVAAAMEGEGRYLEAFDARDKRAEVWGNSAAVLAAREERAAFLQGGQQALIRLRLRRVMAQKSWGQQYSMAKFYCQLGDVKHCLGSLEKAVSERGEGVIDVVIDPSFDVIHGDPRYAALVEKFGFTATQVQTAGNSIKGGR